MARRELNRRSYGPIRQCHRLYKCNLTSQRMPTWQKAMHTRQNPSIPRPRFWKKVPLHPDWSILQHALRLDMHAHLAYSAFATPTDAARQTWLPGWRNCLAAIVPCAKSCGLHLMTGRWQIGREAHMCDSHATRSRDRVLKLNIRRALHPGSPCLAQSSLHQSLPCISQAYMLPRSISHHCRSHFRTNHCAKRSGCTSGKVLLRFDWAKS